MIYRASKISYTNDTAPEKADNCSKSIQDRVSSNAEEIRNISEDIENLKDEMYHVYVSKEQFEQKMQLLETDISVINYKNKKARKIALALFGAFGL